MLLPLLSECDPIASSEGSIDPLGMVPISDSLANKLVPGVRERQSHPRFLTAIAIALAVCRDFSDEMIAADRVSEPWQVFEWYVVEGLVRAANNGDELIGLPGREKVAQAIRDGVPLNAGRYLKTPATFGFHGVYRVLSRELDIEVSGCLGETGYNLLAAWAKERGISGFYGSSNGDGLFWRKLFIDAVKDGLGKGAVARSRSWQGWSFIKNYMGHRDIGKNEAKIITNALRCSKTGYTKEVFDFLISSEGKKAWRDTNSEREYHEKLSTLNNTSLKQLLSVIKHYENFSRLLFDAFTDCLFYMSKTRAKTPLKDFARLPSVIQAAKRIPALYCELIELLSLFGETDRFQTVFSDIADKAPPIDWVRALFDHHIKVQRKKPPNGKAPWFYHDDEGTYMVRTGYLRSKEGPHNNEYVHAYRTNPLWSFASDLNLVN